jgi:uncharacterized LabA/DUF88 family protein
MKAIIFNDRDNSNKSLSTLNKQRSLDNQRVWKIKLFHDLIFQKVMSKLKNKCNSLELVKTFIYTGEYNAKALNNVKKSCSSKIKEMNDLIAREDALLEKINCLNGYDDLKVEVTAHVESLKEVFEDIKQSKIRAIQQQSKNAESQKRFFEYVTNNLPFTEMRTTPLVTRNGVIQQKGVDAKFATDLLLLSQSNAFDVAILLTGDADLKESIQYIRERHGKLVFLVACYSTEQREKANNTISEDLLNNCDCFINLCDISEEDILKISTLKTIQVEDI